jgi:hypothetical protein
LQGQTKKTNGYDEAIAVMRDRQALDINMLTIGAST